jgi:ubiquinone/menaquinone biosynthesis C-methylase UbiE
VTLPSDGMRELYEARAAQQYGSAAPLPDPRLDRKFARICATVRALLPCDAFLDAGCGDGRYLAALDAELPDRVAGVDISQRILDTARERVARADLRRTTLESLPFADGEFDLVLSSQVIEHVLFPSTAVRELTRVLRPAGRLVISTDNARNRVSKVVNAPRTVVVRALGLRGRRRRIESPATPYTRETFRELLESADLEIERLETFRYHLMWPLDRPPLVRAVNAIDERVGDRGLGDILLAIARKP